MVNFRYHIVSLIAVFVALCLGVVLGAGLVKRGACPGAEQRQD